MYNILEIKKKEDNKFLVSFLISENTIISKLITEEELLKMYYSLDKIIKEI